MVFIDHLEKGRLNRELRGLVRGSILRLRMLENSTNTGLVLIRILTSVNWIILFRLNHLCGFQFDGVLEDPENSAAILSYCQIFTLVGGAW